MISSVELQAISRILTTESDEEINTLCSYDDSYYAVFNDQINFILDHRSKYGQVPDVFTFQAEFPDLELVKVREPISYIETELKKNKQFIILNETFNKIKDLSSGDVSVTLQYLQSQCEKAQQLDSCQPLDIVHQAKERAKTVEELSKQARIPTGFAEIDKLMYGGLSTVEELLLIVARTNSGKAQPLWSKVLTPSGWKKMGNIQIGDVVVGQNNDNGRVVEIFPQGVKDYYRITFNDGTYAECCDDHLWNVLDSDRRQRSNPNYGEYLTLTTKELRTTLDRRYSVDISEPIEFDVPFDEENELDGYLLGVILGDGGLRDGSVTISNESDEMWKKIEQIISKYHCIHSPNRKSNDSIIGEEYGENFVRDKLVEYGLMNKKSIDKFIPKHYLTAPVHVRKALLAGLVDTDGYAPKPSGAVWEFDTASEQLAFDFAELARSLGVRVKVNERKPSFYIKDGVRIEARGSRHLVCRSIFNPFTLSVKAERYHYDTTPKNGVATKRHCKMIESIELVGQTECQCIMLDNKSHTYITDDYILTHNTWVLTKMMEASQKNGFPVLFYSPEMQGSFLATRFDTWRIHFPNSQLHQGKYDEQYWNYLEDLSKQETSAYILEDKDMTEGEVNVRGLENLVRALGIKLLIIDGLSYMADVNKADTDYIRYKNICNGLFKLSKQYHCAVVIAMQANRETRECRDDKGDPFPNLYNVEGSDHPARICTQAFAIRQVFDKHVLDIRLEKSRNANNQKPVLSYSWDINTGNMQYLPNSDALDSPVAGGNSIAPVNISGVLSKQVSAPTTDLSDDDFDEEVEF